MCAMCFYYYSVVSQICRASERESTFGLQPERWLSAAPLPPTAA